MSRIQSMNRRLMFASLFVPSLLMLGGCSSYVQRIVTQSIGKMGDPIPAAPHLITTPVLPDARLAVSWVGHATVLIQMHDKLIVTDPFFTNTIGLLARRSMRPGLDPKTLPKVDFTIISHIHFDHFNYGSLDMLPKGGELVIPQGALQYTPDLGFKDVDELKPWESIERDVIVEVENELKRSGIPYKFFNDLPIKKLGTILSLIDLYITNDTGSMHIAGFSDAKMISLFGPTNPEEWAPAGENKYFIKSKNGIINNISVNEVYNLTEQILEKEK